MARLFTTPPENNKDNESLEIEIELEVSAPSNSSEFEFESTQETNTKIKNQEQEDKENLKFDNKSSQMTTINTKLGGGMKKQKLINGSWLKLLSLPSQELVSELKVKFNLFHCIF